MARGVMEGDGKRAAFNRRVKTVSMPCCSLSSDRVPHASAHRSLVTGPASLLQPRSSVECPVGRYEGTPHAPSDFCSRYDLTSPGSLLTVLHAIVSLPCMGWSCPTCITVAMVRPCDVGHNMLALALPHDNTQESSA